MPHHELAPGPDACPSFTDAELNAAVAGVLPEQKAVELSLHLESCPICQTRMNLVLQTVLQREHDENSSLEEPDPAGDSIIAGLRITPPAPDDYGPGERIGTYEVITLLGRGGSSTVYDCFDPQMDRRVAVKVLTKQTFLSALPARQEREARLLARLDHPWIVKAYEVRPDEFPPYIVMERVAGGSSRNLVKAGPLKPRQAASLIDGVARALQHAHENGVLHRDIKPSNLLVVQPFDEIQPLPEELSLKISDFGLARSIGIDSSLTSTNAIIGTPAYMSPEQSRGNQTEIGPAADIYSLGAVLYEYLVGRPPLLGDSAVATLHMINEMEPLSPRSIQSGIPLDLDTICMKCLRKTPTERYTSARELADDLRRFLEGRPILARPVGPAERLSRWCRRNRRLAASLALSAFLIILSAIGGIWFGFEQSRLLQVANTAIAEAQVQSRRAEVSRSMALKDRDAAVKIMDDATTALYNSIHLINKSSLTENPEVRRLRDQISFAFFEVAANAHEVDSLEREKPDYLCGLLFKTAVLRLSSGSRDQGRELLERMLEVYSRIPEPLRNLDGLTFQIIAAREMMGDDALVKKDPETAIAIWLASWSEWYGKGEKWLNESKMSASVLNKTGQRLCTLLEQARRTTDLQRIKPQVLNLERIIKRF